MPYLMRPLAHHLEFRAPNAGVAIESLPETVEGKGSFCCVGARRQQKKPTYDFALTQLLHAVPGAVIA